MDNEYIIDSEIDTRGVERGASRIRASLQNVASYGVRIMRALGSTIAGLGLIATGVAVGGIRRLASAMLNTGRVATSATIGAFQRFGNLLRGAFRGGLEIARAGFSRLRERMAQAHKGMSGGIKTLLKYVIGLRSLQYAFNLIKNAVKEGIKNMAQFNNGVNPVNVAMSNLTSSLDNLKNALGTAFAPILTVVEPILTGLIDKLTQVATTIGMVIARLGGQSTFIKATKVQKDYASSLDKSSKSAKGALASFDELNTLQSKDTGGGAGSVSPDSMFEEVKIPSSIDNMIDNIKEKLSGIFAPIMNAWATYGQPLIDSMTYAFNSVKNLIISIGKSFAEVWQNGTGEAIVGNILQIFTNISLCIGNIANQLNTAWNTDNLGTDIIQSFANVLNDCLETLNQMTEASANWSANLDFTPALSAFLTLQQAIEGLVSTINDGLAWAWENVVLPFGSYVIENGMPEFMNTLASAINAVKTAFDVAKPSLQYVWEHLLKPMGQFAGQVFLQFLQTLKNLFTSVADKIQEKGEEINNILTAIGRVFELVFKLLLKPIIQFAMAQFEKMASYIDDIIGDLIDIFSGLIDFIAGVFTADWERAWNGITNIFKGIFNLIADIAETIINGVISGLNAISFDIPDWVPALGGKTFGFNMSEVHFPRLAEGTVVPRQSREFMAMLGDNNRETEVVSPLSTMEDAMRNVLSEMNTGNGDVYINASGDIGALVRMLRFEIAKEDSRVGATMVKAGVIA